MNRNQLFKDVAVLVFLQAIAFICFWDVLRLNFFSDDFYVIHRLTIENKFWAPGFFRPLSDLTLLFSYYTSGYSAFGYRLFNVLLHGINGFILFKTLTLVFPFRDERNSRAAFIAALLFVAYPFHTESIVWIVGRASLVANTFGILSVYFFFSRLPRNWSISLSCLAYFIGLASYESIFVIPGIIFLAVWHSRVIKAAFMVMIPYTITLVLHLAVRWYFAGVIAGNYGKDMFGESQTNYAAKFVKSFGRLFVPPIHNNVLLVVFFALAFACIAASFILVKKYKPKFLHFYMLLWLFLLVSHIIPTLFGVDTHTSDGDRLLYFPSYFLCAIVAYVLVLFGKTKQQLIIFSMLMITIGIIFIKRNNTNWIAADAAIHNVLEAVDAHKKSPIVFANMPDAIEGGFVFRNGFYEALAINKINANVHVLNYLLNQDAIRLQDTIIPVKTAEASWRLPPSLTITKGNYLVDTTMNGQPFTKAVKTVSNTVFLYWNRNKVLTLLP